MNDTERAQVWIAMSDLFLDTEINYRYVASRIDRHPASDLRSIFFGEVAPVCGPNLLSPVPPIWMGFEEESLIKEIRSMLTRSKESMLFRIGYKSKVIFYRWRFSEVWNELESHIKQK